MPFSHRRLRLARKPITAKRLPRLRIMPIRGPMIFPDRLKRETQLLKRVLDIKGKVVLDAGCGSGEFMVPLSKSAKRIVGVDLFDTTATRVPKQVLRRNGVKNAQILKANLDHIPVVSNTFDSSYAIGCVVHGEHANWKEMTKEIVRVTKPKKPVVISYATDELDTPHYRALFGLSKPNQKEFGKEFKEWCQTQGWRVTTRVLDTPLSNEYSFKTQWLKQLKDEKALNPKQWLELKKFMEKRRQGKQVIVWKRTHFFVIRKPANSN